MTLHMMAILGCPNTDKKILNKMQHRYWDNTHDGYAYCGRTICGGNQKWWNIANIANKNDA